MTGEVHSIDQTGLDSNGDSWPIHAAIAQALGGKLCPFDSYQGPYIVIGEDIRIGNPPYAIAPTRLGVVRLWVCGESDWEGRVYREDTDTLSDPFPVFDELAAIAAAESLFPPLYKCADPDCPGLPYKASERSHQGTCKQ